MDEQVRAVRRGWTGGFCEGGGGGRRGVRDCETRSIAGS